MKSRHPQQALRLDATAERPAAWCDGAAVAYLGGRLALRLDTDRKQPACDGASLHLPLPPDATARQVQDAAEAWLRQEALRLLHAIALRLAVATGRPAPSLRLSFAARSDWVRVEAQGLRCSWRLIEQAPAVIEQVLERAMVALPGPAIHADLFAMA